MTKSDLLQPVCDFFELGKLEDAAVVKGGRTHTVYRVRTSDGFYIIKGLERGLRAEISYDTYRHAAAIVYVLLKHGLPVLPALIKNDDVICEVEGQAFMAYHYVDGQMTKRSDMTVDQCCLIAEFIARMHLLQLDVPAAPVWNYRYKSDTWQCASVFLEERHKFSLAPMITRLNERIRKTFSKYVELKSLMNTDVVIGHRDLDSYNVLWPKENEIVIIDWDLAGYIDAAFELMYVALGFAHVKHLEFDFIKFKAILSVYHQLRPIKTTAFQPVFYTIIVNWLNWCQDRLALCMAPANDLSDINAYVVSVRHSLETFEYIMSLERRLERAWSDIVQ